VGAGARAEPQGAGLEGAPSPLLRTLWIGQVGAVKRKAVSGQDDLLKHLYAPACTHHVLKYDA
jgi:hypothetical protein